MKDPLCKKNNPYEILDLGCDSTVEEAMKAVFNGVKNSLFTLVDGQRAFRQLKNAVERIMTDLMLYDLDSADISDLLEEVTHPDPDLLKEHIKLPEVNSLYFLPSWRQLAEIRLSLDAELDTEVKLPSIREKMNVQDIKPIPSFQVVYNE